MRKLIFKSHEPERHELEGQVFFVRPINAGQFASLMQMTEKQPGKSDFELVRLCVLTEDKQPAFATLEEVEELPIHVAKSLLTLCVEKQGLGEVAKKKKP